MPVVPRTSVKVSFYTFSGVNPPLYYGAQEGTLNLASVNAGNSNGLCVGLQGVNGGFLTVLTAAKQTRANLSPGQQCVAGNYDDYQDRHVKLVAKAATAGTAWEAYANTDPCAFSYVQASLVNQAPGYYEGICFADVFDPALCPNGNPKNAAMLYAAPPLDTNYSSRTAFLAAIQATAGNIIKCIAGYNAVAAQQKLPVIEALRNTLYSSGLYNSNLQVPAEDIARAILAGFAAELKNQPHCGLVEIQFPVGTGTQAPLFAALEADLAPAVHHLHMPIANVKQGNGVKGDPIREEPGRDEPLEREMVEAGAQGADVKRIVVNGAPLQTAAGAVLTATDTLVTAILGGQAPVDPNYGRVTDIRQPDYEGVGSALGGSRHYLPVPAKVAKAAALAPNAADSAAFRAAKKAGLEALEVLDELDNALDATKIPTAEAARDRALIAAKAAVLAATQAEVAARAAGATAADAAAAAEARAAADTVDNLANRLDSAVKGAKAVRRVWNDAQGKLAVGRGIAGMFSQLSGGVALGGMLLWIFVFGGGRKVVGSGVARFNLQPIKKNEPDTATEVTVDVLAEEGNTDLKLVKAVHLLDANGKQDDQPPATSDGAWMATGTQVKYTVKRAVPVSISYAVEAVGAPGAVSDPATLSIDFYKTNTTPPGMPVDIAVAALDRTSRVSIDVQANLQFSGPLMNTDGIWSFDAVGKKAIFTPAGEATGVAVAIDYSIGSGTATATLTIVFPAVDVTLPLDPKLPGASRQAESLAPTTEGVKLQKAPADPLADTLPEEYGPAKQVIGNWTTGASGITFSPKDLPDAVTQVIVPYVVVRAGVASKPGKITVNFADATMPPVATNIDRVTADRRSPIEFSLTGAQLTPPLQDPNGYGSWRADLANNKVIFTPATLAAGEVKVSMAFTLLKGTAQSNPANLTITFLPTPDRITRDNVSRLAPYSVDVAAANTGIQADYTVKLWNGTAAVDNLTDSVGGKWSIAQKSLNWSPPAAVLQKPDVTIQYVLRSKDDGTVTAAAPLTLTFSTKPVASSFTVTGGNRAEPHTIEFLDHCFFPTGYKDVNSTSFNRLDLPSRVTWEKGTAPNVNSPGTHAVVILRAGGSTDNQVYLDYSVVDQNDNKSDEARITVDFTQMKRFLPQAADMLLSEDVSGGQLAAADVLSASSSFYAADPKSVKLTGLAEIGQGRALPVVLLEKDGKSLRVSGEGVWLIDDSGKIGFQSDKNLTQAPSAVSFQFSDVKGNVSNQAVVAMDPVLAQVAAIPAKLTALDDATFWTNFQQQVSRTAPALDAEVFIAIVAALAGVILPLADVGGNPVSVADFDKAYQAWIDGGQLWDDPVGTANPVGLFSICQALVKMPAQAPALAARYWQLELMSRMASKALSAN